MLVAQLIEQHFCLFQIGSLEAFGEPVVNSFMLAGRVLIWHVDPEGLRNIPRPSGMYQYGQGSRELSA
jgi:hypothetical protein